MADTTIHGLTGELITPGPNDEIGIWDLVAGQYKIIKRSNLVGATVTGGGTIATGGFTLTVPATGTAALLAVANVFSAAPVFGAGITPEVLSLTSGQTRPLSDWATITNGLVFIFDQTGGNSGLFAVLGGSNTTVELFDSGGVFSSTIGTGSSINVAYSSGYQVRNNQATTRSVGILAIGA